MGGNRGQITLRLAYPVRVTAVTVEHTSSSLISEEARKSAPKKLKVIGYPRCDDDDGCSATGFGFDTRDALDLTQLEYEIDGSSLQTFEVIPASSGMIAPEEGEEDESEDEGTCSTTSTSCGAPYQGPVGAVTIKILGNYGNPSFELVQTTLTTAKSGPQDFED